MNDRIDRLGDQLCSGEWLEFTKGIPEYYSESNEDISCDHSSIVNEGGVEICTLCGVIDSFLDYANDRCEEGNRCIKKYEVTRCIDSVFANKGITMNEIALDTIDSNYKKIVKEGKVRGKSRESLIAICYFFYFRHNKDYRTLDDLTSLFGVTRKDLTSALSRYLKFFPEDRTLYLYPEDLVARALILQGANLKYEKIIVKLCSFVRNKSKVLNRSTPQSIATALVYLYFDTHQEHRRFVADRREFARKSGLSEITIDKIVKEIRKIFSLD